MVRIQPQFSIDDSKGTNENLAAYVSALERVDAELSAALAPHLSELAAGHALDAAAIWNALFVATAARDTSTGDAAEPGVPTP